MTRTIPFGLGLVLACLPLAAATASAGAAVDFGDVNQIRVPGPTGGHQVPASIVSGRFDDDVDPDLAVAAADELRVFLGAKKGTFQQLKKPALRSGFDFVQVVAARLDADERLDLIALGEDGGELTTLLGEGNGGFRVAATLEPPPLGTTLAAIDAGDLDGDGNTDLAGVTSFNRVHILLGDGAGGLTPAAIYDPGGLATDLVAVERLDPGPSLDIAVAGLQSARALLNDGTGGFVPRPAEPCCRSDVQPLAGLDVGDLNGDAIADLVVGSVLDRGQIVAHPLLGDGAGGFEEQAAALVPFGFTSQLSPDAMRLADVDRDGRLDLLSSNEDLSAGSFAVLLGDGAGGFASHVAFSAHKGPSGLVSDDFNGDGRPDVATANHYNGLSLSTFLSRRGQVKCRGRPASFVGFAAGDVSATKGRPRLSDAPFGTSDGDVLSTGAGKDFPRGAGGDDAICAGGGDDRVSGAKGSDLLAGGGGSDRLNGGSGKDRCVGGPGRDRFKSCEKIRR
jgi:Ca2+-binding RTX toxin-like protein